MKKTLFILALLSAIMVVGCHKEKIEPGNGTVDSTSATDRQNPLKGHTWYNYDEFTFMGYPYYSHAYLYFITDSTGEVQYFDTIPDILTEDTVMSIVYTINVETNKGSFTTETWLEPVMFTYDTSDETITTSEGAVYIKIE